MPYRAPNAGLVCARLENQEASERGRIAVTLRNAGAAPLPPSQALHRFGVQVGLAP